jgi:hypothetical protein
MLLYLDLIILHSGEPGKQFAAFLSEKLDWKIPCRDSGEA